jgi:uncharacterized membrane protein YkvA (DUF1232 family)
MNGKAKDQLILEGQVGKVAKKSKPIIDQVKAPGFFGELWRQVRLVFYLMKDPEVPVYLKILPLLGFLYILFPIDIITDVVPVLGQLDDLTILVIGSKVFIEMAPPQVVARYLEQMRSEATTKIVEGTATDATPAPLFIEGEVVKDDKESDAAEKSTSGR